MRKITLNTKKLCVILSALILMSSTNNHIINKDNVTYTNNFSGGDACEILKVMRKQYIKPEIVEEVIEEVEEQIKEEVIFKVSAYDLSLNSCGKSRSNPAYGLTASGYSLRGHTLESARTIATDLSVIPMDTRVKLTFKNDAYTKYNDVYTVRDIGGGIVGNSIDLFFGDYVGVNRDAIKFGVTEAIVTILDD